MVIQEVKARLVDRQLIADDTYAVDFKLPKSFHFTPGQYVTVTLPSLADQDYREQYRDFSIASSSQELPKLQIIFRAGDSLFKRSLESLKVGSEVIIHGAKGVFTLPNKPAHIKIVAGGVGITPFLSMCRSAAFSKGKHDAKLYYFNKSADLAVALDELKAAGQLTVVAREGLLTYDSFDASDLADRQAIWYVAGPPGFMAAALQALAAKGVDNMAIRTEEFTGYA